MDIIEQIKKEEFEKCIRIKKSFGIEVDIDKIKKNIYSKRDHLKWLKENDLIEINTFFWRKECIFIKYEQWRIYFRFKRKRINKYMQDQKPEYFRLK